MINIYCIGFIYFFLCCTLTYRLAQNVIIVMDLTKTLFSSYECYWLLITKIVWGCMNCNALYFFPQSHHFYGVHFFFILVI